MAIATGTNVPASKKKAFAEIASGTGKYAKGAGLIGICRGVRMAERQPVTRELSLLASSAAAWLRSEWEPVDPSQFYADRREEVINGVFDPAYWADCTKTGDETYYSTPEVGEYTGGANPNYFDIGRQPTKSKWIAETRHYPTPEGDGTEENPGPGWAGRVIGGYFNDLWLAQRVIRFTLANAADMDGNRPIAIKFSGRIIAEASFEGSVAWFQLSSQKSFYNPAYGPSNKLNKPKGYWARRDTMPMEIPGRNPAGWAHTRETCTVRNARESAIWLMPEGMERLAVKPIIPPSDGFMFARNDAVTVRHRITVNAYQAIGPDG